MKNYTTMGELMKVAQTKMDCHEKMIKWYNRLKKELKKEYNIIKKKDKDFSKIPFEVYILMTHNAYRRKDPNPNQVEIDYIDDVTAFYFEYYQDVNEEYKIDKRGCKSLFEYIFTAFDIHNTKNWSMSLSDVSKLFKNFTPQD